MGTIDRCLGLQECEVSLESQSRAKNHWHGGFGGGWKPQLPAAAQATDSILCALRAGHVVVGMSPKLTGRQRHGGCVRVSRLTHQASRSSHQAVGEQHLLSSGPREIQQGEEAVMRARFCLVLLSHSMGQIGVCSASAVRACVHQGPREGGAHGQQCARASYTGPTRTSEVSIF